MPFRFGPVGLNPTLAVTNFGIDDNIFDDSIDPQSDFTMTVTPRLQARLRSGKVSLSGALATGLVYYQKFDDQRSIDYATTAAWTWTWLAASRMRWDRFSTRANGSMSKSMRVLRGHKPP